MARKEFTEEHLLYGRHGESATGMFFEQIGFDVVHLPDGKFGTDLLCKKSSRRVLLRIGVKVIERFMAEAQR